MGKKEVPLGVPWGAAQEAAQEKLFIRLLSHFLPVMNYYITLLSNRSMRKLSSSGVHMNGFGLPAALRAYLIFIRPILEYGLPIVPTSRSDIRILKKAQNMCLRTCIRRPNAMMGAVHIAALAALPNLFTCSRALQAKFLRRAETLPSDSCTLEKAQLLKEHQPRLKDPLKEAYVLLCQKEIDMQLASVNHPVTIARGLCKPVWDLVLLLPCTRSERRLECQCGAIKDNRNHMLICSAIIALVQKLWALLDPAPPPEVHPIDYVLNCLPRSFKSPGTWCDLWPCLLALLRGVDQTTSSYKLPEEKAHDQILIDLAAKFRATKPTHPHRIPPPTQEPVPGDPFPYLRSEISTIPRQPPPFVPARNYA
ncbi:hypothetical protein PHYBLDRAFT_142268 [Phycomyces blakesleeanus NRRL 1555(-)]|uniref:Uncharacterized protein n=1 Tax=Phycomyces blakesleeanus (strain ATCC 8743b / DSM 1359 / FGSC 10004 / NBRC 33097 / NRRL 1555) TaxID=763407 RepID=A0A163E5C1_PHYB8|nr:hypothetical protein PHYBLDRAFT_142268 [Phycomyces blakesleeanus NRRL 1555(-)]OAD76760.1 hypothetical protein PHYBLDRAFT_142268 [Phycomyces blakesleeanus NRRL 1555(-)]|eukprot:XP_018294800.1 hypothetical protein PHYBLDRAFT_142268 [Phycomyces blakesleeanus NRRL 1555(-)]